LDLLGQYKVIIFKIVKIIVLSNSGYTICHLLLYLTIFILSTNTLIFRLFSCFFQFFHCDIRRWSVFVFDMRGMN